MKTKITDGLTGLVGAAVLTANAAAQTIPLPHNFTENIDARVKVEYNGDFDQTHSVRETIGFGKEGIYDGRTSIRGQFFDNGRLIFTQYPNQDKSQEMFGVRLEPQKISGITNSFIPSDAIVFGSISQSGQDSVKAIASEAKWPLDNKALYLRGELQNGNQSLSHLGGTFRYDAGNWTFQIGEDHVSQRAGNFNQLFANISLNTTKNDFYALTFAHQDLPDNSSNNRLRFTISHFGKDSSWGHRSFMEYSFNPEKDQQIFFGQLALVPFGPSTYGKIAARLFSEDTWDNDSFFSIIRTPFALYTEAVPHYDRILGGQGIEGLGLVLNAFSARNSSSDSASISGQVHYIGKLAGNKIGHNEYGVYAGPRYNNNGKDTATYLDTGATLRFGKNFSLRTGFGVPINTETRKNIQGVLEIEFKF